MPRKPKGNGHSAYDNVIDVYNCKYSLIISIRPLPVENGRLENQGRDRYRSSLSAIFHLVFLYL